MPGNIIVGFAISIIVIGFLILAGVAIWLAAERRRTLSATPGRPAQPRGSQPAAKQPATPPANQQQKATQQPAATSTPAAAPEKASSAAGAGPGPQPPKEVNPSGEYPKAAAYDQTILPEPPRRRTRPRSN